MTSEQFMMELGYLEKEYLVKNRGLLWSVLRIHGDKRFLKRFMSGGVKLATQRVDDDLLACRSMVCPNNLLSSKRVGDCDLEQYDVYYFVVRSCDNSMWVVSRHALGMTIGEFVRRTVIRPEFIVRVTHTNPSFGFTDSLTVHKADEFDWMGYLSYGIAAAQVEVAKMAQRLEQLRRGENLPVVDVSSFLTPTRVDVFVRVPVQITRTDYAMGDVVAMLED